MALPCDIGPWTLLRRLGGGPLTEVFQARPSRCGPNQPAGYALKLLRREWENESLAIDMLRREAYVGLNVRHPRLIGVLAGNFSAPPRYLVMPWLPGQTLRARLDAEGALAAPQALWTARQVAEALSALHTAGWLHLDVKPENILLSPDGQATLLDLTFARRIETQRILRGQPITGTPRYMAPELLLSTSRAGCWCDLFSLGIVLLEMLCGRLPYEDEHAGHWIARKPGRSVEVTAMLSQCAPEIPAGTAALIGRLLAAEPLRRPESAAAAVDRLVRLEIATLAARFDATGQVGASPLRPCSQQPPDEIEHVASAASVLG
jgi:serine/threonine-protein kinase